MCVHTPTPVVVLSRRRSRNKSHNTRLAPGDGGVSYSVEMSKSNFFTWFDGRAVDDYRRKIDPTYVKVS